MNTAMRFPTSRLLLTAVLLLLPAATAISGQYTVRSTADGGAHSLRWAMLQANATAGPDVISFELPGPGPHAIVPTSPLPALTDPDGVVIDGLSQPGAEAGARPPATLRLRIVIDGIHAGAAAGLCLRSSNNPIQGLVIVRFEEDGIRIESTPQGTSGNTVRNCIVGLDPEGITPLGSGTGSDDGRWGGVSILGVAHAPGTLSGNSILTNIISSNIGDGIILADCPGCSVSGNTISGNFIGTTRSGDVARGNGRDGVLLSGGCHANTVAGNLICGNSSDGIHLTGVLERSAVLRGNVISRNHVGVSYNGNLMGNGVNGVNIGGREYGLPGGFAAGNTVNANIIAGNRRSGIVVWEHDASDTNADGNRLTQNSIYANGRLGIDLGDDGVTLNDPGDGDNGPNQGVNTPVILSAHIQNGMTTLRGDADLQSAVSAMVEIYKQDHGTAAGGGFTLYLGSVSPDAEGNWAYSTSGALFEGDSVHAIVIDADGNTSEFSRTRAVVPGDAFADEDPPVEDQLTKGTPDASISSTLQDVENGSVTFTIDVSKASWTILEIYSAKKELVETVVNRWLAEGRHTVTWDGRNWRGDPLPPGSYTCCLDANGVRQRTTLTRKVSGASQ